MIDSIISMLNSFFDAIRRMTTVVFDGTIRALDATSQLLTYSILFNMVLRVLGLHKHIQRLLQRAVDLVVGKVESVIFK